MQVESHASISSDAPGSAMTEGATFTRDGLLGGMPGRRATTLLFAIESRTARIAEQSSRAMATYLTATAQKERERAFLTALSDGRSTAGVTPQSLERYASSWASLVPSDAETTAALAAAVLDKYQFRRSDAGGLAAALRIDDPEVVAAYRRQRGRDLDASFAAAVSWPDRLRWWRTGLAIRLETLPPAITAFALTLTETIGAGILALPIAFAAVGPVAAVVMLIVFGLLNLLTVAGLVEAITRSGTMRYGSAYFGRFVGEYFGRTGNVTVSVAILLLNAAGLVVLIFGFGTSAAGITGLSPVLWAALLAAGIILILRRESLDATVASVLLVGSVNIVILVAIVAIALVSFDATNFSAGLTGDDTSAEAALGLVFGTALMAFFGHTSAGNAAKVVLERDPSGRGLLWGNVAAIGTALLLYLAFLVAVLGAVPADELIGFEGTALTPLVAATGTLVATLGLIFIVMAMGLSSLHMSLSLYNQVGERLPLAREAGSSRWTALLATPRVRTLAKTAPVLALLLVVELMLISGVGSFTESLSFLGTVTLPLLAGLFPMMLLVATRRRGEYIPGRTTGVLAHPAVAVAIGGLFFAGLMAHALVIWSDPLQRFAALVAAGAMLLVLVIAVRDHVFRPRLVAEIRVGAGRPAPAVASVVAAGERAGTTIHWTDSSGQEDQSQGEARLPAVDELAELSLTVPSGSPQDIRVWVHRIDDEGVSRPWPVDIEVDEGSGGYPVATDDLGLADFVVGKDGARIRVSRPESRGGTT